MLESLVLESLVLESLGENQEESLVLESLGENQEENLIGENLIGENLVEKVGESLGLVSLVASQERVILNYWGEDLLKLDDIIGVQNTDHIMQSVTLTNV